MPTVPAVGGRLHLRLVADQHAAVRVFGAHTWAVVLSQMVEGVLSVLVLHRAVRRPAGTKAARVAAVVSAATPVTVARNRADLADTLMVLLVVVAADAVMAGAPRRISMNPWRDLCVSKVAGGATPA